MTIAFKDFVPQVLNKQLFGAIKEYEDIAEVVTRANRWLARAGVRVLSVETLTLPKAIRETDGLSPAYIDNLTGENAVFQVVRVWYEEPGAEPGPAFTGQTQRLE